MAITEIIEPSGALSYLLPLNARFEMPALGAEVKGAAAVQHFDHALKGVDDMLSTIDIVNANPELTELGRARKIEPKKEMVVEVLANRWDAIECEERLLKGREEALFAPPKLDPTHSAMAVEEREIRDWWRGMTLQERTSMLQQIDSQPGHERLMLALMRSPIPVLGERDVKVVHEVWRRTKRLDNPGEAAAIETGLAVAEWARRGISSIFGVAKPHLRDWSRERMLRQVLASSNPFTQRGTGVYGFDAVQVVSMKQRLAAEAQNRGH